MEHSLPLISTLVIAFSLALVFGYIAERFLKTPALVGYLLAGIAAGQHTPGFYADPELANQLSEIGVMLLMFGVGLHFSFKDLLSVKGIALPGAVLQMTLATFVGAACAHVFFDRHWNEAFMLGLSLSCASTVVLLKALEVRGLLDTPDGHIAVGWLVVEDLATVVILVMLPPIAQMLNGVDHASSLNGASLALELGKTLLLAAAFVVIMLLAGRRALPWAMSQVAKTGSRELFTLFVLACAVGVAYGAAEIFHVSFALGAFFAGMVMQGSKFAHRAATESLPLQDAFSVLFFVAVGMLFDWHILIESPLEVLAVLLVIILGKALCAFFVVWFLRYPLHTAIAVAVSLAQIGEFSFILVGQAQALGLASDKLMNLVVAGSILSIALNPVGFGLAPKVALFLTSRWEWARRAAMRPVRFETLPQETAPDAIKGQVVVAGRGSRFFEIFAKSLKEAGVPLIAAVESDTTAEALRDADISVIRGSLAKEESWIAAHLHAAKALLVVEPSVDAVAACHAARRVAPGMPIIVVSGDTGAFPEAELGGGLRFLSTEDAASRLLAAKVSASLKEGMLPGDPIEPTAKKKRAEKDQKDAENAEDAKEGAQDGRAAETPDEQAIDEKAAEAEKAVHEAEAAAAAAEEVAEALESEYKAASDAAKSAEHRAALAKKNVEEAKKGPVSDEDVVAEESIPFSADYPNPPQAPEAERPQKSAESDKAVREAAPPDAKALKLGKLSKLSALSSMAKLRARFSAPASAGTASAEDAEKPSKSSEPQAAAPAADKSASNDKR